MGLEPSETGLADSTGFSFFSSFTTAADSVASLGGVDNVGDLNISTVGSLNSPPSSIIKI